MKDKTLKFVLEFKSNMEKIFNKVSNKRASYPLDKDCEQRIYDVYILRES